MIINRFGRKVSLRSALSDTLTDNLPSSPDMDAFLKNGDFQRLLDILLNEVQDHVNEALKAVESITG